MPELDTIMPEALASMKLDISGLEPERTTTTTLAGTRYPINGVFTFPHMMGFSIIGDTITCDLSLAEPKLFKIHANIVCKTNGTGKRPHFGVMQNDVELNPELITGAFLKVSGEAQATGGLSFPVYVETGDEFRFVTWSDQDGLEITLTHFTAHMEPTGR